MRHVAFEGVDGSGKSTVLAGLYDRLRAAGIGAQVVGKRDEPGATAMTDLIVSRTVAVDPRAEAYLRLAREYQRLARAGTAEVVLLDRSLPSLASMIQIAGLDLAPFAPALQDLRRLMPRLLTVHCAPPFSVARARLEARARSTGKPLSKKEARGPEYNRRIAGHLGDYIEASYPRADVLTLDTAELTAAECVAAAFDFVQASARASPRSPASPMSTSMCTSMCTSTSTSTSETGTEVPTR